MGLATAIAIGGLALGVGGTVAANRAQRRQAAAEREVGEAQRKQNELQNARQKREAVRAARLAYGQSQQAAANQGVALSSASQGGLASIASQVSDNISFLDQYGFYSDQASKALGRANQAASSAATAGSIANLGFSMFGNSAGIANVFAGANAAAPMSPQTSLTSLFGSGARR